MDQMQVIAIPGFKQDRKVANRFFYTPEAIDADITVCRFPSTGWRIAIKMHKNMRMASIVYGKIRKEVQELKLVKDPLPFWSDKIYITTSSLNMELAKPTDKCMNCGCPARVVMLSYPAGSTSLGVGKFCDNCLRNGENAPKHLICHICRQRGRDVQLIGTTPYTGTQSSATRREFRVHKKCVADLDKRFEFRKRVKICF